ncbi:hypothetical protein [Amycolatopsis pithecellobii]|uniref:Uncharacterized protein n=1 Tax=Amycolatopsis pithecellobii TaxID=664692 RepID=A0A6N7YVQ3_9PSEU|nr:hypothetical protein [Amycolatopsis pithecellobii]MTD57157.1 hypothetical protein [Amycolatopsis pithecellobii]
MSIGTHSSARLPVDVRYIDLARRSYPRPWWRLDASDEALESWQVTASVRESIPCPTPHVADVLLDLATLAPEDGLADLGIGNDLTVEYIVETLFTSTGALRFEVDTTMPDGPARMVVLRRIEVEPAWRGHGLGVGLLAASLAMMGPFARFAVCRLSPVDWIELVPDRVSAELACVRAVSLIEKVGFRPWRGMHLVNLHDADLRGDPMAPVWDPYPRPEGRV